MQDQISQDLVINLILESVRHTQEKYYRWSGNDPKLTSQIPEYLYICDIANSLASGGITYITIESRNIKEMLTDANAVGQTSHISRISNKDDRIDILIKCTNKKPKILIEAKRDFNNGEVYEDVKRLRDILLINPDGASFEYGLLIFAPYRWKEPSLRSSIESHLKAFEDKGKVFAMVKDYKGQNCAAKVQSLHPQVVEMGNIMWGASCLIIEPPPPSDIPNILSSI